VDFGHSRRFAALEARRLSGDLYPGPVLMPRGLLRALDPLVAVALGPARFGSERFEAALERMLRGRPSGPLLLCLWSTVRAGEIPHGELRRLVALLAEPAPDRPATRQEILDWLEPRTRAAARCVLPVFERHDQRHEAAAGVLGAGLTLTAWLRDLGTDLAGGRMRFPAEDLEAAGLSFEELRDAVPTPGVRAFLARECAWARSLLHASGPLQEGMGGRLRRGLRAMTLRAEVLLARLEDPRRDPFRRPPRLRPHTRWRCALRALLPHPVLEGTSPPAVREAQAAP